MRQSVFGRLAGYEDVNDVERLACDPVMRTIIGREGLDRTAASSSQMGRFETEWLATEANLAALTDLPGAWIDRVHDRKPPHGIILDMDFLRTLALPQEVEHWSLTTLRENLIKMGARIMRHGRYVVFQPAEVAVPSALFAKIPRRIDRLRPRSPPLPV